MDGQEEMIQDTEAPQRLTTRPSPAGRGPALRGAPRRCPGPCSRGSHSRPQGDLYEALPLMAAPPLPHPPPPPCTHLLRLSSQGWLVGVSPSLSQDGPEACLAQGGPGMGVEADGSAVGSSVGQLCTLGQVT